MPQTATTADWHPASWRDREALQQPTYPDEDALQGALDQLETLPPLVTAREADQLKSHLAEAAYGNAFLLQGGDCAEHFADCTAPVITNRLKIMLQMSLVLVYGLKTRVVRAGRFAGQFAKPRSSDTETREGETLPSYRGDIVNSPAFTEEARVPDPNRMLRAYRNSAVTLNHVRALAENGFADLHHPENWDLDFAQHSSRADEYEDVVRAVREALSFVETISETPLRGAERADLFTSHEALLLPYEETFTRQTGDENDFYNLATHFPWVGKRTGQPDGAHVEYMRGIRNPIGLKVGPNMTPDRLTKLADLLDPDDEPGRLTLITRLGADDVSDRLPPLIEAVERAGRTPLWCCDPMHGNTERTSTGLKTRHFDTILSELEQTFEIHDTHDSRLGGVHLELTGEDVTECVGGARGLTPDDLERAYESNVDPRLNCEQALEVALRIMRWRRS
jgi:3-deoxy-7-phosphoheptulonate synthase